MIMAWQSSFKQEVLYKKAKNTTTPKTNKHNACTMFKSKQQLVCMAIPNSRRFDRSRGSVIIVFEPVFLAVNFCTERIFHHEPNEKTKIKVPLHKKSRQKKASSKTKTDVAGYGNKKEGQSRTCPNANPLKRHGCKSHTAFKPMASNVQQCIGNIRIVCIQRVAKDHKHNRKSYAEGLQHGLLFLGKTYCGIQISV